MTDSSGSPTGGRFAPNARPEVDLEPTDPDDKREERLAETLEEIGVCLYDGAALVGMGKERFDHDWLTRRAAKNVVTEFAEAANRLPDRFKEEHPEVPWRAINGLRNRVVHVYEHADPEIIWNVLAGEFPTIHRQLDIGLGERMVTRRAGGG